MNHPGLNLLAGMRDLFITAFLPAYLGCVLFTRIRIRLATLLRRSTPLNWRRGIRFWLYRGLYSRPSGHVAAAFLERPQSRWFRQKLGLIDPRYEQIQTWTSILADASFCEVRTGTGAPIGGYASLAGAEEDERYLLMGLERWLLALATFRRSATDHELTHCAQHHFDRIFAREWGILKPEPTWRQFITWEKQACIASPLVTCCLLWPVVLLLLASLCDLIRFRLIG